MDIRRAAVIVVDTSLLVHLYVTGDRTADAEAALARDPVWAVPLLGQSEFRNALLALIRHRGLALEDAIQFTDDAERRMAGREHRVVSAQVLRLAAASGCSAYDCEFVTLAQNLGIPFVTTDRQILKAFPSVAVPLEEFARQ